MTYKGMHKKVARLRGQAVTHRCVDCRRCAAEWSWSGALADALWAVATKAKIMKPYTLDVDDYRPRCRSCHRRFDHRERAARRAAEQGVAA